MKKANNVREMWEQFDEEFVQITEAMGWVPIGEERMNELVAKYKNNYPEYAWCFCPNIGGILFDDEGNVISVHKGV